jgi:hypothetical protein
MKNYSIVIFYLFVAFCTLGMLVPFLVSSESTIDVGFGVFIVIMLAPFTVWSYKLLRK